MVMSPSIKKYIAIALEFASFGIILYWALSSGRIFTMTRIPVEVADEIFGTTSIEWRDGFLLGLEYAAAISVILTISAWLFYRSFRKSDLRLR